MSRDKNFMSIALDLARLGLGRTSPNPAVGSVIVKKGKIVATGFHKKAGMPHAEIEALNSLVGAQFICPPEADDESRPYKNALQDSTLYVTLEPCCHHGRTPPCTDAIIQNGIKEVVVGMKDPDSKVAGKGIQILKKAGIKVRVGVLKKECQQLNEAYIKHRKTGIPFVTLKAAMTLDGKVGLKNRKQLWITGPEAREQAHVLRDRTDAILVGVDTIIHDNPLLTTRLSQRKGRDPVRIVLDSKLRIPLQSKILNVQSSAPTWIVTMAKLNHPKAKRLQIHGVELLFGRRDRKGRVDLKDLLKKIGQRGILTLLVEGGPRVWESFLNQHFVDRFVGFVAPTFLGSKGLPFYVHRMPRLLNMTTRLLGEDLCLEGDIRRKDATFSNFSR